MKINYHITVEGSIGVGKTSLAKILSEEFQAQLILEKFEENPFLSEFYKNSKQYAFGDFTLSQTSIPNPYEEHPQLGTPFGRGKDFTSNRN